MAVAVMAAGRQERRLHRRYSAVEEHGIVAGRVRPGFSFLVIDISAGGISLETACRMLPGTSVDLHLQGRGTRTDVRGRVLRCWVARLTIEGVRYRGAVRFVQPLAWPLPNEDGYGVPDGYSRPIDRLREDTTQTASRTVEADKGRALL